MQTFLIGLLALVALVLITIVLLQSGKGGGLAAAFGGASSSTESFLGGRQAATLLTKASWVLGAVFLFVALTLSILSTQARAPRSVLEGEFQPTSPQPLTPTPLLPAEGSEGATQGGAPPTPLQPAEGSGQPKGPEGSGPKNP